MIPEEKENNSLIFSIRIKVEHAIGGVRRMGVAKIFLEKDSALMIDLFSFLRPFEIFIFTRPNSFIINTVALLNKHKQ